jgi:hypothetical protein
LSLQIGTGFSNKLQFLRDPIDYRLDFLILMEMIPCGLPIQIVFVRVTDLLFQQGGAGGKNLALTGIFFVENAPESLLSL